MVIDQSIDQVETESAKLERKPITFEDLNLIPQLLANCLELGYKQPTPIQIEAIPLAMQGKDIIGIAQTGSGKTAAFVLPILNALWEANQVYFACILAPTRELAIQIKDVFEALGAPIGVRTAVLVGGMDMIKQAIQLTKHPKPHIIIATPGRLHDHLENTKGFSLSKMLKYLVMDEADKLLEMDFGPKIDAILKSLPKSDLRITWLFSATMTNKVAKLQRASLKNPVRVAVSNKFQTVKTLTQYYVFIPLKHKEVYLVYILNELLSTKSCLVFVKSSETAIKLSKMLKILGISATSLYGKLSMDKRIQALNLFKSSLPSTNESIINNKNRMVLIATDVASRGLDMPLVDFVFNYDLPMDSKTYLHRVGRTARAGRFGTAISIVSQYDVEIWQRLEATINNSKPFPAYPLPPSEVVLLLLDRVLDAQRFSAEDVKLDFNAEGKVKNMKRFIPKNKRKNRGS